MRYYIGLIHKDADSDYGVSFPDFPGVATAGTSLDDAQATCFTEKPITVPSRSKLVPDWRGCRKHGLSMSDVEHVLVSARNLIVAMFKTRSRKTAISPLEK